MPWSRLKLSVEFYSTDAEEWWNTAPARALRTPSVLKKKADEEAATAAALSSARGEAGAIDEASLLAPAKKKKATTTSTKVSLKNIVNDVREMKLIEAGYEEIKPPDLSHVITTTRLEGIDGARIYRNTGTPFPHPEGLGPILVEDGEWGI